MNSINPVVPQPTSSSPVKADAKSKTVHDTIEGLRPHEGTFCARVPREQTRSSRTLRWQYA